MRLLHPPTKRALKSCRQPNALNRVVWLFASTPGVAIAPPSKALELVGSPPSSSPPPPLINKRMIKRWMCCIADEPEAVQIRSSKSYDYPWEAYTLKELIHATNNFHDDNKLGEGGFGTVYWGRTKGVEIAVKRLKAMTPKAEMEFAVEVEILGRVRHKNLLGLRGFYAGSNERLIVYDYMPNHSLTTHLHGHLAADVHLDWPRRMEIAIGSAEGLAYLHHEASPHIIHRDIKASNVLLDSDFRAKVADFGFAKLVPEGVSHMTTKVKGTLGYLAPEYAMWGKVSESCDVYSFGILLLEVVSGRRPIEKLPGGIKRDIVQWAAPWVERGQWETIADPRLGGRVELAQVRNTVAVAMRCTNGNPENRPKMGEVVELLKRGVGPEEMTKEVVVIGVDGDMAERQEDDRRISEASECEMRSWRMPNLR